jgi:hypothetical protein
MSQALQRTIDYAELVGKVILPIGVMTGAISGVVAVRKYFFDREAQDRNNALQSYRAYMKVAFDNPQFAYPRWESDEKKWEDFKKNWDDYHKYRWFVAIMLMAFEEIICFVGKNVDAEWNETILIQLRHHLFYLHEPIFADREMKIYDLRLQRLIKEAVDDGLKRFDIPGEFEGMEDKKA